MLGHRYNCRMTNLPPEYAEFAEAAQRYCACIEDTGKTGTVFLQEVQELLLVVYLLATRLPEVSLPEGSISPEEDEKRIGHDHWQHIFSLLSDRGFQTGYRTFFRPLGDSLEDAVFGNLADDLADIWRDLEAGLRALALGKARAEICWEWKFSFQSHWGHHAIDALAAIRAHLQDS